MYHTQTREWVVPRKAKNPTKQAGSLSHFPGKSTAHGPSLSPPRENPRAKKEEAKRQVPLPKLAARATGSSFLKISEAFILKSQPRPKRKHKPA